MSVYFVLLPFRLLQNCRQFNAHRLMQQKSIFLLCWVKWCELGIRSYTVPTAYMCTFSLIWTVRPTAICALINNIVQNISITICVVQQCYAALVPHASQLCCTVAVTLLYNQQCYFSCCELKFSACQLVFSRICICSALLLLPLLAY